MHIYKKDICHSVQFSSVAQSCLTLCDPMKCSTPGIPVHYQLPEFEQAPGVGNGQGSLMYCSPELDTTEWLNWTELNIASSPSYVAGIIYWSSDLLPVPLTTWKYCCSLSNYLLATQLLMFITFEHVNILTQFINSIMVIVYIYYGLALWTLTIFYKQQMY